MVNKNDIKLIEKVLEDKRIKKVAMVAPSFLTDFTYPSIVNQLKSLGFDEVVEVTFGAKLVNKEYHNQLKNRNGVLISSTCPGISSLIKNSSELDCFEESLAKIDSPMTAMGKVCRKLYPKYKIFFISPCHMKKTEANKSKYVDFVIDYAQLKVFFQYKNIKENNKKTTFDKLYNDYTKIYPLSGGLTKTARIKNLLAKNQFIIRDGFEDVRKILLEMKKNPRKYKDIKFLDVTFCKGGCIGGPCTNKELSIRKKHKLVKQYMKDSLKEKIPKGKKGLFSCAKGLIFRK
jgi:iron only hydrogenase large subunit-like protein